MRRWLLLTVLLLSACGAQAVPPAPASGTTAAAVRPSAVPSPTTVATALPTATVTPERAAATAPFDPQLVALRAAALPLPDAVASAPHYTMQLHIDPAALLLSGTQQITFTNRSNTPLTTLVLRSYPNFPPDIMGDGGTTQMNVVAATLNGAPLEIERQASNTAFVLHLPAPLQPGATSSINTSFNGTLEPWDDGSLPVLSAYPLLAVWEDASAAWRMDVTRFPDRVFAEAAWYTVDVTLPSGWQISATGAAAASSTANGLTTTTFVSGPVREWAAIIGKLTSIQVISADGVLVQVWQERGASHDSARIAAIAQAALEYYEQHFGAYPYRELDVYAMRWHGGNAGIEYPGLVMILISDVVNNQVDFVVAHEVAHQWWYNTVGNDIYHEAWLDESLANFSAGEALRTITPEAAADLIQRNIINPDATNHDQGFYRVGRPISDYPSFNRYYWAVYGSGAVFLQRLQATMGAAAFEAGLQDYYATARFEIAHRATFFTAMQQAASVDVAPLFNDWIGPE